jgi:hypothetical protein
VPANQQDISYQTYSLEEIKAMHERELTINARGDTERVPYPITNPPIVGDEIKRPKVTTYEQGLEWNKQAQEHADSAIGFNQEYAKRMVEPKYGNKIMVVNLSDLHWGHFDTDYSLIDKWLKIVEQTPDTYCTFGWNILDAAIPAQFPDGVMWSGQTAQEQVYTFKDKIDKLWKQNKILSAIGSGACHEGWSKRKAGWQIYRELFGDTDIPLLLNGGYLDIQVGDENYRTAHFHKLKYWSSLNKTHGGLRALDRFADAEIVFTSHYHFAATGQTSMYNPPFTKDVAVIASGTAKIHDKFSRDHFGTEGEEGGQAIILWSNKHAFQAIFDLSIGEELMKQ